MESSRTRPVDGTRIGEAACAIGVPLGAGVTVASAGGTEQQEARMTQSLEPFMGRQQQAFPQQLLLGLAKETGNGEPNSRRLSQCERHPDGR